MQVESPATGATPEADLAFQAEILQQVSRTYALTIPRLPPGLREVIANAYLLCRIADTIEDEPLLDFARKEILLRRFTDALSGRADADAFAAKLSRLLSNGTSGSERKLAANTGRIVRITRGFSPARRRAIERCLGIMAQGMVEYQRKGAGEGLRDMAELDRYSYCVAGVVAEMLAELFCDHSPATAAARGNLMALAPVYGQGLQMTNILKDIWSDLDKGICWLPREPFLNKGFKLAELRQTDNGPDFDAGFDELVAAARQHLRQGLNFILLIPRRERGIRRHLLLTLGMAAMTLRRIQLAKDFRAGRDFFQPKRAAPAFAAAIDLLAQSNLLLRGLFRVLLRNE